LSASEFEAALAAPTPPREWPELAQALWWDARQDWDRAHRIAQADDSPLAARIHGYLHRVEGDLANASYWYDRAGVAAASGDLAVERLQLAELLLTGGG
jgi:hypothetical protein